MEHHSREVILDLAKKAFGQTGYVRVNSHRFRWRASGRCERPIGVSLTGRPITWSGEYSVMADGDHAPVMADLSVRCRRCRACLRARKRRWQEWAFAEYSKAAWEGPTKRVWFGTLTLAPAQRNRVRWIAEREYDAKEPPPLWGPHYPVPVEAQKYWKHLSEHQQFERVCAVAYRDVQKWFKRLRKSGSAFRYLVVFERHRTGDPHLHVLLFERGTVRLRKSVLEQQWSLGLSHFRLCDSVGTFDAAHYVTKYLTKDFSTRVRASGRERLREITIQNKENSKSQSVLNTPTGVSP